MRENCSVTRYGPEPGDDPVDPFTNLIRGLAAGAAVTEDHPARSRLVDLRGAQSLIGPVVPFAQVRIDLRIVAEAGEFEGRVLLALALAPVDAGMPAYDDSRTGGPRWIVAGRRPGYLQEKLAGLAELARWCAERGRRVQWA